MSDFPSQGPSLMNFKAGKNQISLERVKDLVGWLSKKVTNFPVQYH